MTDKHLANLRNALLKLEPAGAGGFEGLLAAVLSQVCGQPFRLASSGTQRGRDGDSAFDAGATYFEAKRYDDDVPKKEVAIKIMDLKADNQGQVDTWIIGATAPIPALNAGDFRAQAEADGIGIVLLDWSDTTPLPALATVIAMAEDVAKDFLRGQLTDPLDSTFLSDALSAIDYLAGLPEFSAQSNTLREELKNPSVGLGLAKAANQTWLRNVFSREMLARQQFGQPLAPNDANMDFGQPRAALRDSLKPAFMGPPSNSVFVVIGPEGAGKSWLVANTWMQSNPAAILLFATAGELRNPEDIIGFEDFLVRKLIAQTGGDFTEANQKRWKRRFAAWRANPGPQNVRLALCADGLNQNLGYPWARWIDGASLFLGQLGGQLVVTTRTSHFPTIRQATASTKIRIPVPEWTKPELDAILRTRGIDPDILTGDVFETLKNPRILSIAVNLIDARDIEKIEQLSVGRLLFEHLRTSNLTGSTNLSPTEFAKTLKELAAQYISRLDAGTRDDLTLFDTREHLRLSDVSSGRFFRPVGDDPDRYEIVEDGLRLSLGIWLVDALEKEQRNGRDPFAQLEIVMEPVTALDITADIVASATEVACLKDTCPTEVASALIRHFVGLQNLPEERRESFGALVRKNPEAFVKAARDTALVAGNRAASDWLGLAILKARDHEGVRHVLEREIPQWLSYYSLASERILHSSLGTDSAEKVKAEREKAAERLEKKLQNLTGAERTFIETNLVRLDEGDLARLHLLAFSLLAGLKLEQFARALFSWAFSDSINSTFHAPHREFEHLVRFNHADWHATRAALVKLVADFGLARSSVGNWAVVQALRATGDQSDAAEAERLVEELTKDRERFPGWRLVENYCATDPCDPDAPRPDNIAATAARYRSMPVDQLRLTMGNTQESHFFDMALPGVARFEPEAGTDALRRLARHMLARDGLARRQAILTLLPDSVLMERADVDALVAYAQSSSADPPADSDANEEWLTAQYSLFTAMPHLSGNEQLQAIDGIRTGSILLDIMGTLKPADPALVESLLETAFAEKDAHRLIRLLAVIHHTDSPLTPRSTSLIADLLAFPDKGVRAQALAIAAATGNDALLRRLAESDWDAGRLTPENDYFELWYGSAALLAAVDAGILEVGKALDRMALSHYGFAAMRLGRNAAELIADRIEIALGKVLNLGELTGLPEIERGIPESPSSYPPVVDIREDTMPANPRAALERLTETNAQFQERQRHLHQAFEQFSRELKNADALLVVTDLTAAGMTAVLAARPDTIEIWHALLINADKAKKKSLHLFAIQFAGAIAETHPDRAVALFRAYGTVSPFVRHVVGRAKVPVEAEVLWSRAKIPEIAVECIKRLDDCTSDREISIEVLAAFSHGQEDIVAAYVERLLTTKEPVQIARALTVAGFSDETEFATRTLSAFKTAKGFVCEAYRAAQYAYDRNRWARQWWARLQSATTALDFWRYSILLSKIVDGRFDLWASDAPSDGSFSAFFPTIEGEIKQRIKKWSEKRKDKLFGSNLPHPVFLIRDFSTE